MPKSYGKSELAMLYCSIKKSDIKAALDIRGQPADTRTAEQKTSMRQLLEALRKRYPRALIVGHRDLSHDRDCPCFQCGERIRRPSAEIDHQKSLAISARLFI